MLETSPPPRRYHPISQHYRERFGCKVYKISVSLAQTCPNREGVRGMTVCVFCDQWGSAAYHEQAGRSLTDQVAHLRDRLRQRLKADKFLVYFQAFTHTYQRITHLQRLYEQALAEEDVVGIVVGTRPDCLPPAMVRQLGRLGRQAYVSVELGVQTLDDGQLDYLARGHDAACSLDAVERLRSEGEINICAHLMFGLPGETEAQLAATAATLSDAGIHGVKLHNLHVLRGTELERRFRAGQFAPIGLEEYAGRVCVFLEHLSPEVAVHRLSAVASRWEEVVAPAWVREKMRPAQRILAEMERRGLRQGDRYRLPFAPANPTVPDDPSQPRPYRPEAPAPLGEMPWA